MKTFPTQITFSDDSTAIFKTLHSKDKKELGEYTYTSGMKKDKTVLLDLKQINHLQSFKLIKTK